MHNKAYDESFEAGAVDVGGKSSNQRHRENLAVTDFGNFRSVTPPPEDEADAEDSDKKPTQLKVCFRRFTSLMLSHLGTLIIVVFYVIMGGFLFNYLEVKNEISSCSTSQEKYLAKLFQTADLVYALSQGSNATEAQRGVLSTLESFAGDVYALNIDPSFNCSSYKDGSAQPNWNIVNAAYFCVTIVTTIGYGHICPGTQWGQVICIVYGIIGIPLMLLFLSKIGEPTAILFRNFYLNIFCCKCFVKRLPNETRLMRQLDEPLEKPKAIEEGDGGKQPPPKVIVVDDDEDEEEVSDEAVNIPIMVTIMLLALYVIIGALVFRLWEKWTLVEGAYFSFITLATIGFGDYVPGRNGPFDSTAVIIELVIGCIYCLFGLALLSMCINLIQDEISAKFHWIGTKMGLVRNVNQSAINDEEDEDDEEDDEESDEEEEEEEDAANGSEIGLQKQPQPPQLQRGRNGQAMESRA